MKARIAVLIFLCAHSLVAVAEGDYEKSFQKYLEVSKFNECLKGGSDSIHRHMRDTYLDVPDERWDEFRKGIDESSLRENLLTIARSHLTKEEMDAYVSFFNSPIGQSISAKFKMIREESNLPTQMWQMNEIGKYEIRLAEKGYKSLEEKPEISGDDIGALFNALGKQLNTQGYFEAFDKFSGGFSYTEASSKEIHLGLSGYANRIKGRQNTLKKWKISYAIQSVEESCGKENVVATIVQTESYLLNGKRILEESTIRATIAKISGKLRIRGLELIESHLAGDA